MIEKLSANSLSLEPLTFIQSYWSNRIRKVKINSSFSGYSHVESDVPQGSISGSLFLNIFICNVFNINIWYQYRSCKLCRWHFLIWLSSWKWKSNLATWKNIGKLFDWFSDNFLKAHPDKCHLLINTGENVKLKIKNETM